MTMVFQDRLSNLRQELNSRGVDGFIVPRTDQYQGEYIPPDAERLAWLSGFTGSAGLAIVLNETAAIFVDGRYTLQLETEVSESLYTFLHLIDDPAPDWVASQLRTGQKLAYDPWLMTPRQIEAFEKSVQQAGGELVSLQDNPIDAIWHDRPPPPRGQIVAHPLCYNGRSSQDKCTEIAETLREGQHHCAVIAKPESIAWLLNVRGADLDHSPLPLSLAIIHDTGKVDWFVEPEKISPEMHDHLDDSVTISGPDTLEEILDGLCKNAKTVRLTATGTAVWISHRLISGGAQVVYDSDPCELPRARKNQQEISGARNAHLRDGVALTRFLCWLNREIARRDITEMEAADYLADLRREGDLFKSLSFDTIAGSGSNGAIVHYRVNEQSNRTLVRNSLFLVDSGGQYLDGTTDVTRTISIGQPDDEMRDNFTRVLQGHIALAMARFPAGTTGSQLDPLARQFLWRVGLDYDHGTGHGVGSYLNVHEGPQRISKSHSTIALEPGMIISNEPGYYKPGCYGIRMENLVAVRIMEPNNANADTVLGFETLTRAPIDLALINTTMMTNMELGWLNEYHATVYQDLCNQLDPDTARWLKTATQAVH
jgi:Xaa-Pro aminopeptidase